MKRKNATRNALFTSIISLLLCVSMLVGTTFAWFTDSVVSGNNVIAAGNLDIELLNNGTPVTTSTNLFDDVLWEPGVVVYENFTIQNKGNLAMLYNFAINWGDYNTLAGEYNLTQILKVAMVDGHVSGNRDAAIAAGAAKGWAALDSWSFKGEMTTKGETKDFALIIYWEPSVNDNNWNVQNGKTLDKGDHLYVNLGINLQATQKMHESDSFGTDYDALANPWDGSAGEVPEEEDGVITISTAAELAAFAEAVNNGTTSYAGKTVKLGTNINLNNQPWTAIGDCESGKYFQGTFDGQGYTIYNLYVDYSTDASMNATAGLFGWVDSAGATIKNVKIDGATVKGSHWTGVIAGYFTGTIENCSVNNATVIGNNVNDEANGDKIGGIVGCLNEHSYLNNNTVTNSTITGNRDLGGIAGSVAASTYEMKNNKVEDTVITYNTSKDYGSAGEFVSGRTGYVADDSNVATDVTITWVASVSNADELKTAVTAGATNIYLQDGEYNIYDCSGKTLTISGSRKAVIKIVNDGESGLDAGFDGSTVTFNGVTFDSTENIASYKGFTRMTGIYNDCAFVGEYCTSNYTHTFNNCYFETKGYIWTWGADAVTFNNCEFGGDSRNILAHGGASTVIDINNCKFAATEKGYTTWNPTWTAAVEIDPTGTNTYTITIDDSTINANYSGWTRIKDGSTGHTITVDGEAVVQLVAWENIDVAETDVTRKNMIAEEYVEICHKGGNMTLENVVFENGLTIYTLNADNNGTITLKDCTIYLNDGTGDPNYTSKTQYNKGYGLNLNLQNGSDIKFDFDNCTFTAAADYVYRSENSYNVYIGGGYSADSITFNVCTFEGSGKHAIGCSSEGSSQYYALNVTGCNFKNWNNDSTITNGAAIRGNLPSADFAANITISGNTFGNSNNSTQNTVAIDSWTGSWS